jgi:hypothetical protein
MPFASLLRPRALLIAAAFFAFPAVHAQERPVEETEEDGGQTATDETRLYDRLVSQFQRDYLRFTALVQVVPYVPLEDAPGDQARFDVAAARLGIGGRLDGGIGYYLRAEFARSPALLDAYVSYGSENARVLVGQQKVPFSREFITGAGDIDFVNRSRAVRTLVPGREVGFAFRVNPNAGPLTLRGGVFNADYAGDDFEQRERGGVVLAGRAETALPIGANRLTIGANAAYDTPGHPVDLPGRFLFGADARLRAGRFLAATEGLVQRVEDQPLSDVEGGYLTLGFDLAEDHRVLARLDHLRTPVAETTELLLGYNHTLTRAASFQANAAVPLNEKDPLPARFLFNFQLSF